ncbi:Uncharacterised protein [Mesomycoplasma conjunctivae]|nr:Uncharacterised protein [Mesomycoplasma conjunctivae]
MLATNYVASLYIALAPEHNSAKQFKPLVNIKELKNNFSTKKEDKNYFHNKGSTTSVVTGTTLSLSVSIDIDFSNDLHVYLLSLIKASDPLKLNNQLIKLVIQDTNTTNTNKLSTVISGKASFGMKNYLPSGNADEIIKLDFDIFPQDNSFTIEEKLVDEQTLRTILGE